MSEDLRVSSQAWERGVIRLDLRGKLSAATMGTLDEEFERWFSTGAYSFLIHVEHIEEATLAGVAAFIGLLRAAQEKGGRISLLRPSKSITSALELHGVLSLINIVSSPHDFV